MKTSVMLNSKWFSVVLHCTFCILATSSRSKHRSDRAFERYTAPQIIEAHGYPSETHTVTTKAGYILTIHRIPYGRKSSQNDQKIPVLLQHGLFCSSDNWLLTGPDKALGFVLADNGYDVWMPNTRGTKYSRKHVKLTDKSSKYWDFSWHEMGADDTPDTVDYILEQTRQPKLMYIGHSQGTTAFWTFNIFNQDYTDKIIAMFALGPIAYLYHNNSPVIELGAALQTLLPEIKSEFFPNKELLHEFAKRFCGDDQPFTLEICSSVLFLFFGYDNVQVNKTNIHLYVAHTPAGQSFKQLLHYCQGGNDWVFRQYDHRLLGNKLAYGQPTPPDYDLSKVKVPVYLYWGPNDPLAGYMDVQRLKNELGNLAKMYPVPFPLFNHFDFLIAKDIDKLLYKELLKDMRIAYENIQGRSERGAEVVSVGKWKISRQSGKILKRKKNVIN